MGEEEGEESGEDEGKKYTAQLVETLNEAISYHYKICYTTQVCYFICLNNLEFDKGIGKGKPLDATDFANGDKIDTSLNDGEDPIRFAIES